MRGEVERRDADAVAHHPRVRQPRAGARARDVVAGAVRDRAREGALIFSQAPECRRITGVDPTAPEVVEAHARALARLVLEPPGH